MTSFVLYRAFMIDERERYSICQSTYSRHAVSFFYPSRYRHLSSDDESSRETEWK